MRKTDEAPGAHPEAAHYAHEVTVTEADIDALGHTNNISYLRWVQDVAAAHSIAQGLALADYQGMGAVFVIRSHTIEYLRPSLLGQVLQIDTWISDARGASCDRATEIRRKSDGVLLATAVTKWVYIDTATGRPRRIDDAVRIKFGYSPRAG